MGNPDGLIVIFTLIKYSLYVLYLFRFQYLNWVNLDLRKERENEEPGLKALNPFADIGHRYNYVFKNLLKRIL